VPANYLVLDRAWKRGDTLEINFDFSFHFWAGERECADKASIYRGPLLLTYDRRFNEMDPNNIPVLEALQLTGKMITWPDWLSPILLMEFKAADGRPLRLCDFASAGAAGNPYRSWLEVRGAPLTEFSPANPLRSRPSTI
jgi:hypothetical protein